MTARKWERCSLLSHDAVELLEVNHWSPISIVFGCHRKKERRRSSQFFWKWERCSLLSHNRRVVKSQSLITNFNCIWVPQNVDAHHLFWKWERCSLLSHNGRVVKSQSLITNSNCIWVPQNVVAHHLFWINFISLTWTDVSQSVSDLGRCLTKY